MHPPASSRFETVASPTIERRNSNTKNNNSRRRPRTIAWAKKCHVKVIATVDQYSEQEKADSFYGPEDYQRLREETSEVCFLMKHGTKESDELTYRGLEFKRDGESRRRKLNRLRVNLAVFEENDKQFEQGYYDAEAIGDIYRLLTAPSRIEALERAAQDAKAVGQQCPSVPSSNTQEEEDKQHAELDNPLLEKKLMKKLSVRASNSSRKNNAAMSIDGGRRLVVLSSLVAQQ